MSKTTQATLALSRLGVAFETLTYDYDPGALRVGLQAAEALGEPAHRVLKTLMMQVDGEPVCVVLPSDREANLKKVAAAFGGKTAAMMPPPDAERVTGYKVGGVSPFGRKRRTPLAVEAAAMQEPYIFVNGGQRGLQLRMSPADLVRAGEAIVRELITSAERP